MASPMDTHREAARRLADGPIGGKGKRPKSGQVNIKLEKEQNNDLTAEQTIVQLEDTAKKSADRERDLADANRKITDLASLNAIMKEQKDEAVIKAENAVIEAEKLKKQLNDLQSQMSGMTSQANSASDDSAESSRTRSEINTIEDLTKSIASVCLTPAKVNKKKEKPEPHQPKVQELNFLTAVHKIAVTVPLWNKSSIHEKLVAENKKLVTNKVTERLKMYLARAENDPRLSMEYTRVSQITDTKQQYEEFNTFISSMEAVFGRIMVW